MDEQPQAPTDDELREYEQLQKHMDQEPQGQVNEQPEAAQAEMTQAAAIESSAMQSSAIQSSATPSSATQSSTAQSSALRPEATHGRGGVARPFRVKLRGSVLVLVRLPNRRDVRAAIHQLSTSGGVIHLEKPLDEKLEVELVFHLGGATIRAKGQMLFPMWATQGWMQPFRFVDLSDSSRESLDAHLKSFLGEAAKSAASGA